MECNILGNRLQKIILFFIVLVLASSTSFAYNFTRNLPSTVNGGGTFEVEYTAESDADEYFVAWIDNISGGCDPEVYEGFIGATSGGRKSDKQTFSAPNNGSCMFVGIYQFIEEDSSNLEEELPTQTITIIGGGPCTVTDTHASYRCYNDDIYYYDNCNNRGSIKETCSQGCVEGQSFCNVLDSCNNGVLDENEIDVDCGGSCGKCSEGQSCDTNDDCETNNCVEGVCESDSDDDGIIDDEDNCPEDKNPDQSDMDNDGEGDICDEDIDGDQMPNDWELEYGLNPNDNSDAAYDKDKDGLTNYEEFEHNTNPTLSDTDNDGYSDKEEVDKGTDPTNPESKPSSNLWLIIIIIIFFVALVVFIAYVIYNKRRKNKLKKQSTAEEGLFPKTKQQFISQQQQKPPQKNLMLGPLKTGLKPQVQQTTKQLFQRRVAERAAKRSSLLDVFWAPKKGIGEETKAKKQITKIAAPEEKAQKKIAAPEEKQEKQKPEITDVFKKLELLAEKRSPSKQETKKTFYQLRKIAKSDFGKHKKIRNRLENVRPVNKKFRKSIDTFKSELDKISMPKDMDTIIALKDGSKYHKAMCVSLNKIPKTRTLRFKNIKEAEEKGLKPCSICFK